MIEHVTRSWVTQALFVAAKLGIADALAAGPLGCDELAARLGTHPQATYRLLRMLASVGIFVEDEHGRFANNDASSTLRDDAPGAQRATIIAMIELGWRAWGELATCIETGEPAFPRIYGKSRYQALDDDPELSRMFDRSMAHPTIASARAITAAYDFSPFKRIVDVGGGDGTLLAQILDHTPHSTGVLFERAAVLARAHRIDRCEHVAGDFFTDPIPRGDAVILKAVLHNWDDAGARAIVERCAAAAGTLLLIEPLIPPGNAPSFHKLADVHMLVMHGGRERSLDEYSALLGAAGMRVARTVACGVTDLVEAVR
jgi:hypothetical protein